MKEFFKKLFTKETWKKIFYSYLWVSVLVFILDIVSKWLVVKLFDGPVTRTYYENGVTIIPNFLFIGRTYNKGAAWSLGSTDGSAGKIILMFVSIILSAALIWAYVYYHKKISTLNKIGLVMMIGGSIGNLIDRAFYWDKTTGFTGVVDWILFTFGNYSFPMFNIADSALVIGIGLMIIQMIIDTVKEGIEKGKNGEYKYSPDEIEKQKQENEGNNSNE